MGRDRLRGDDGRAGFLPLRTISNFTYEIVKSLGEIAMDGNFRKKGHGCPFFSTRSV